MLSARGVQLVFFTMYICAGITKSIHQTYVRTVVSACCKKVLRVETTVKSEVTAEMTQQSFYKQMLGKKKKSFTASRSHSRIQFRLCSPDDAE